MTRSKYRAIPTVAFGIKFDSAREAARYGELMLLARAGQIDTIELQPTYILAPAVKLHGESRTRPAVKCKLDFRYREAGETVLEDVKGVDTPVSRLKRHLMKSVHGLDVRVVK